MPKPKLLMPSSLIRIASIHRLRRFLEELQEMSDGGDRRPEVYKTFVAMTNEIEHRKLRARPKVPSLISKGASKLMKIGDVRSKYEELLHTRSPTEEQVNTLHILGAEMQRRRQINKDRYQMRKAEARTFLDGAPP